HGPRWPSGGGGEPTADMAFAPRTRMDPPPRSFPTGQARGLKAHADAHDCIMVAIPSDRPNTDPMQVGRQTPVSRRRPPLSRGSDQMHHATTIPIAERTGGRDECATLFIS